MKLTDDERMVLNRVAQINDCVSDDLYGGWKLTNVEVEGKIYRSFKYKYHKMVPTYRINEYYGQ